MYVGKGRRTKAFHTAACMYVMHILNLLCQLIQAKQEYQKVMIQLMEERQQHEAAVAEYKQVCTEH